MKKSKLKLRDLNMLDTIEAAKMLGYTAFSLKKWRCESKGPAYYKIRGHVFYKRSELKTYLANDVVVRIDPRAEATTA